jgi:hypothetical protein
MRPFSFILTMALISYLFNFLPAILVESRWGIGSISEEATIVGVVSTYQ